MYSKRQAKRLGRSNTIDLKGIIAKEYISKSNWEKTKDTMLWIFGMSGMIWLLILAVGQFHIVEITQASETKMTYEGMIENSSMKPPFSIYHQLKDECYSQKARNKKHCVKTGLGIAYAESSWRDNKTPFGLQSRDKSYKKWVSSYNKYWYKSNSAFFFYGDWGVYGASHYCTSEESSKSDYGCPNGRKNMQRVLDKINF